MVIQSLPLFPINAPHHSVFSLFHFLESFLKPQTWTLFLFLWVISHSGVGLTFVRSLGPFLVLGLYFTARMYLCPLIVYFVLFFNLLLTVSHQFLVACFSEVPFGTYIFVLDLGLDLFWGVLPPPLLLLFFPTCFIFLIYFPLSILMSPLFFSSLPLSFLIFFYIDLSFFIFFLL